MEFSKHCLNTSKEDIYKTGVYTIEHLSKPGLYYVGSASCTSKKNSGFHNRWGGHLSHLRNNKHDNAKLQNVVNKYGLDGIRFEILEITSPEQAIYSEQYWINMLQPYYNIHLSVSNPRRGYSKEYIESVRKPILQYDLEGNFIKEWACMTDIKNTGKFSSNIRGCILSKTPKTAGGFQWKYKEDPKEIGIYRKSTSKRILIYNRDGKFIKECSSIMEACREFNMFIDNVRMVLKGKNKYTQGYIITEYVDNYPLDLNKKVKVKEDAFNMKITNLENGEVQYFNSFKEAVANGYNRSAIKWVLKYKNGFFTRKPYHVEEVVT